MMEQTPFFEQKEKRQEERQEARQEGRQAPEREPEPGNHDETGSFF